MKIRKVQKPRSRSSPERVTPSSGIKNVQEHSPRYPSLPPDGLVAQWKQRIENLIARVEQPALFQRKGSHGLLADIGFTLEIDRGNLYCGFHIEKRPFRRRIDEVLAIGPDALELKTSRLNVTESFIIRSALRAFVAQSPRLLRRNFQKSIEILISRNFPKAKNLQSTLFSDLSHSLSGNYVRLHFGSGRTHWTALAVNSWKTKLPSTEYSPAGSSGEIILPLTPAVIPASYY